jgi:hypothetical protein
VEQGRRLGVSGGQTDVTGGDPCATGLCRAWGAVGRAWPWDYQGSLTGAGNSRDRHGKLVERLGRRTAQVAEAVLYLE